MNWRDFKNPQTCRYCKYAVNVNGSYFTCSYKDQLGFGIDPKFIDISNWYYRPNFCQVIKPLLGHEYFIELVNEIFNTDVVTKKPILGDVDYGN